jgi:hypothetical protein
MTFCCGTFKSNFEIAGSRGFGVFSVPLDKDKVAYIVQHRAVEKVESFHVTTTSPVSLISEMYITFCPWCGKLLEKVYGSNPAIMRPDLKLR